MKGKQVIVTALVLWLLVVYAAVTHAQPPPSIPIGPGLTEDKPQSKLWYTGKANQTATWWGILASWVMPRGCSWCLFLQTGAWRLG